MFVRKAAKLERASIVSIPFQRRWVHIPLVIEGKEVSTGESSPVFSHEAPYKVIQTYSFLNSGTFASTVPRICAASDVGFQEWSSKTFIERIEVMKKVSDLLKNRKDEFVKAHQEIGGPEWFSNFNINHLILQIELYISQISQPEGEVAKALIPLLAMTIRQPMGSILSMAPWNAPAILCGRSIAAPLAAGCSVVLKSSERAPLISYLLVKVFHDAGIPPNALQLVHTKPEDSETFVDVMLSNPLIKKVNFTGSTDVGRKIAITAAKYLKPTLLELGGKNYSIVDNPLDLKQSAQNILWSAWSHQGQICMCIDSVYIHESIYDDYCDELLRCAQTLVRDPVYSIPQRDTSQVDKIMDLIDDALQKGAIMLYGKRSDEDTGSVIHPMILKDVTSEMKLDSTESFGPILTVYKYTDKEEVVQTLNKATSCLKASIWSHNISEAIALAKKIESAGVHINSSTIYDEPTLPHGGFKESGMGRFNSSWGYEEFTYTKTLTIN
ncbi:uncharacterized protein PRCAT00006160001 [Priceomyces carsonii]|uniref:uncharacterized protein n=1 Tax=Priceomyces carsonii TaxID=28549 RepID=UPI002ED8008F|nr:unnamed protein product [Priceomyces carsonii]